MLLYFNTYFQDILLDLPAVNYRTNISMHALLGWYSSSLSLTKTMLSADTSRRLHYYCRKSISGRKVLSEGVLSDLPRHTLRFQKEAY